ncbi:fumarate reductase flavoprotein subunit [Pseudobutyrivibrio sp. JW11]|uniref:flavocytochrome c n=1 Tax=Pseudobutyrivibrio sp. JW11 TaxID=1855302 RepID=UPI0008E79B96|nr:flavocytochrome c [Pseudobutyrivibrio sp. JW11]SFN98829.1 fumarate reductase flavoprotein subunit [Pseudobutyrivibrio sp. JW11]
MRNSTKKILGVTICILLALFCGLAPLVKKGASGKSYVANAQGFGGNIEVTVFVDGDTITDITYEAPDETPSVGGVAMSNLKTQIIEEQNSNVDIIAGATYSSTGFLEAVNAALNEAGVVADGSNGTKTVAEDYEGTADIVVIGGGGAGMTAAISAAEEGKSVILLEKNSILGGNTARASSGMNAAETHYEEEQGVEDSVQSFIDDTMASGKNMNDPELVKVLAENTSGAIDWLDSEGIELNGPLATMGGLSANRTHRPVDADGNIIPVGSYLVDKLSARMDELGIEVHTNTAATEIIMEDGKAAGVKATGSSGNNVTIHADAVIVATGGFGGNMDKVTEYRPDLEGYISTNVTTASGDAIDFLGDLNADFVDLDQIQLHPTVVPTDGTLVGEALRGDGAILVNKEGHRFFNETGTRDEVSAAEIEQPTGNVWLIVNQDMYEGSAVISKLEKGGYLVNGDTLDDLAKAMEFDADATAALKETVETWSGYVASGVDEDFGREIGAVKTDLSSGPYYAVNVGPGIHHCMGGVKINTSAEVIDTDGNPIEGLYACGEVTGGIHGANRLGGNAVADIVVYGRIAAESAIEYIDK